MLRRSRTVVMVALTVLGVGCSTVEDDISAVQMAAEQGHAGAQYALGEAYRKGEGVMAGITRAPDPVAVALAVAALERCIAWA